MTLCEIATARQGTTPLECAHFSYSAGTNLAGEHERSKSQSRCVESVSLFVRQLKIRAVGITDVARPF
jgi:hypothetical protein